MILFMRLDKFLCQMNLGTRSEIKQKIKKGVVQVNGEVVRKSEMPIAEGKDEVFYEGKRCVYRPYVYFLMNKPAGVVSATKDNVDKTVMDLFCQEYAKQQDGQLAGIPVKDMFPVGRLDKDTVGLLVLTNDGELAHRILSPRKHIPKTYFVRTDENILQEAVMEFQKGICISQEEQCMPAELSITGEREACLTIQEGKFHQVKRMFQKIGLQVIYLKRISMGKLTLPEDLPEGCIREMTSEEVAKLC